MNTTADMRRWECQDCDTITESAALLTAPHPFDPDDNVHGCPKCKGMDFALVCDEPLCTRPVSCGTPTTDGYRQTCSKHKPIRTP